MKKTQTNPDPDYGRYKKKILHILILPVVFSFTGLLNSQNLTDTSSFTPFSAGTLFRIDHIHTALPASGNSYFTDSIIPFNYSDNSHPYFLDSLKSKASKKIITKKLYELLIVSENPSSKKEISGSSEKIYTAFSGLKIRNIEIKRLDVFGSDINTPISSDPNKIEKFLNATHVNTNEFIIRKNLLFSAGDTISPLMLSDNERIIRQLPYINDARIIVIPVSDEEVDIVVVTKDIYSLGAAYKYSSIIKGSVSLFEKNIFGMGHEFRLNMPYNNDLRDSPGLGMEYNINNILKTFTNLGIFYFDGLGERTYGFNLQHNLISSTTKYAGGISFRHKATSEDLDTMSVPEPLNYNFQDYWIARAFLLDRKTVTRLIFGARYTNNNVFDHPLIMPDSYYHLQKYRIFLGSVSLSMRKYYKTSLIYGYGRTEDIPYGGLINITAGKEINEFKRRYYTGASLSVGESVRALGYFYGSAGIAAFFNEGYSEQGIISIRSQFISNLGYIGRYRLRNFARFEYTRGFDRYSDEYLKFIRDDGFAGFKNDSVGGRQRLEVSLESVLFIPSDFYGFRFSVFGFADIGYLFGTNEFVWQGSLLSSIGAGIRIRNDNLLFNTLQIRLGYFPNLPDYSRINHILVSGEQLLRPDNFDTGPPSLIQFQ